MDRVHSGIGPELWGGSRILLFGKIPIVIVDDHEFRRMAFSNLLASILGEKSVLILQWKTVEHIDAQEASGLLGPHSVPLFLLSAGVLGLSDPKLRAELSRLREILPGSPMLVVMEADWQGEVELAMSLGISGVISTSMPPRQAIAAIDAALAGGVYFPQRVAKVAAAEPQVAPAPKPVLVEQAATPAAAPAKSYETAVREKLWADVGSDRLAGDPMQLSRRQMDVLKTLQSGLSNKEIARALGLSEATVKIHVRHLMRKFGAGNRTQVAVLSRYPGALGGRAN